MNANGNSASNNHYRNNRRLWNFLLGEVIRTGDDPGDVKQMLDTTERVARDHLAPSFQAADETPPTFDSETNTVTLHPEFRAGYQVYVDEGLNLVHVPEEIGGIGGSRVLSQAVDMHALAANPAAAMLGTWAKFAMWMYQHGTPEQQEMALDIIENQVPVTMDLTEPDAGSDVGAGRTRATLLPDGTYNFFDDNTYEVSGNKQFITSGGSDAQNPASPEDSRTYHAVLARINDRPGTQGLGLIVIPSHLRDKETGEWRRNGAYVDGLEHKHGLTASPTAVMVFGGKKYGPALGTLLGGNERGFAQMLDVLKNARELVGGKAAATAHLAFLHAQEFATTRIQGADLTQIRDKTAKRVTIAHHPQVRRNLLTQKAWAEGLITLSLYTASFEDKAKAAEAAGEDPRAFRAMAEFLRPQTKGGGAKKAYEQAIESLDTLGGSGFTKAYPVEQYLRDMKIDTLYEGTTDIQAQDLFFRQIVHSFSAFAAEMETFIAAQLEQGRFVPDCEALRRCLGAVTSEVAEMGMTAMAASQPDPNAMGADIYAVGYDLNPLLLDMTHLTVGWMLLNNAAIADDALKAQPANPLDARFYESQVVTARHFALGTMLKEITGERTPRNVLAALAMSDEAFSDKGMDITREDLREKRAELQASAEDFLAGRRPGAAAGDAATADARGGVIPTPAPGVASQRLGSARAGATGRAAAGTTGNDPTGPNRTSGTGAA